MSSNKFTRIAKALCDLRKVAVQFRIGRIVTCNEDKNSAILFKETSIMYSYQSTKAV